MVVRQRSGPSRDSGASRSAAQTLPESMFNVARLPTEQLLVIFNYAITALDARAPRLQVPLAHVLRAQGGDGARFRLLARRSENLLTLCWFDRRAYQLDIRQG